MKPYAKHTIKSSDVCTVSKSLYGQLTRGDNTKAFEQAVCRYVGASYCVSCSSGTDALWLAYGAVGVRYALVPSITFNATANMVESHGGLVRFADCDHLGLMQMPVDMLWESCVVPVHMNGNSCDMKSIANQSPRAIVEDACHAFGATYNGNPVGCCEFSDCCCFSFHPSKTLTTGEGGCVTTNDKDLYEHMLALRNNGFKPGTHTQICHGRNCHMSEMQAALGLSQLKHVDEFLAKREAIADVYCCELDGVEYLAEIDGSNHLFPIFSEKRDEIREHLAKHGYASQINYPALHLQEYWKSPVDLPGSVRYSATCLSLPIYPEFALSDAKKVAALVKEIAG